MANILIVLIGLPGSGKSTVGRQLARKLSASFVDSDHLIEQRLGCSIREYFEREGETAFRDVEEMVLAEVLALHADNDSAAHEALTEQADIQNSPSLAGLVLATGGGSVIRQSNRVRLRSAGRVVYLRSSPEDLYKRLRHDCNRPLLQGADPMRQLGDLYAQRDPLYREVAHFLVETGRPNVATLVNTIAKQLELQGASAVPVGDAPGSKAKASL